MSSGGFNLDLFLVLNAVTYYLFVIFFMIKTGSLLPGRILIRKGHKIFTLGMVAVTGLLAMDSLLVFVFGPYQFWFPITLCFVLSAFVTVLNMRQMFKAGSRGMGYVTLDMTQTEIYNQDVHLKYPILTTGMQLIDDESLKGYTYTIIKDDTGADKILVFRASSFHTTRQFLHVAYIQSEKFPDRYELVNYCEDGPKLEGELSESFMVRCAKVTMFIGILLLPFALIGCSPEHTTPLCAAVLPTLTLSWFVILVNHNMGKAVDLIVDSIYWMMIINLAMTLIKIIT